MVDKCKEIRILVTGIGRRVELIQAFRQAALRLNIILKLYGADISGTAPALAFCDFTRKVCPMNDSQYIKMLLNICLADSIDLLMPTIDTDLLVLANHMDDFEAVGTKVLISSPDMVEICRNKNKTGIFIQSCGLKAPVTYDDYKSYHGPYPCFIKPKDGSSSINAYKVESEEELSLYAEQIKDYVVQPFIDGREFTIDVFCGFDGEPIYITPRERIQVRAGEVLKTRIIDDQVMIDEAMIICKAFKPRGPITIQLIRNENTGDDYFIEINPRFGGGVPLSMKSGARSAEALLTLLIGESVGYQERSGCNNAIYSRFDQSVCISNGDDTQPICGVIFDLDDTLYSEKQYVFSGFKKISQFLGRDDAFARMVQHFENGELPIDEYLTEIHATDKKDECLRIYREQFPDINLYDGFAELIADIKACNIKVGIITDGRPESQKNKIKALKLNDLVDDIIITDELGGAQFRKPCDIAFRIMQNRWRIPYEQRVDVGDNPSKDFQACRQLGMRWIYFKNPDGMYSVTLKDMKSVANVDQLRKQLVRKEQT